MVRLRALILLNHKTLVGKWTRTAKKTARKLEEKSKKTGRKLEENWKKTRRKLRFLEE